MPTFSHILGTSKEVVKVAVLALQVTTRTTFATGTRLEPVREASWFTARTVAAPHAGSLDELNEVF
jgi:hypothetical protein